MTLAEYDAALAHLSPRLTAIGGALRNVAPESDLREIIDAVVIDICRVLRGEAPSIDLRPDWATDGSPYDCLVAHECYLLALDEGVQLLKQRARALPFAQTPDPSVRPDHRTTPA